MKSTPIRQLRIQVVTAIAVLVASIWGAVAYQVVSERQAALRTAAQSGRNLSSVVAEHFSSYSGGADLLLQRLRAQWTRDPKRFAQAVAAEKGLRKDAFAVQVSVIGADGWLAYTDLRESKQRVFLGDREHFKVHRSGGPDQLYISNPDGVERLLSYRKVPDFPLYAVVGQSLDSLLADFSRGRLFYMSAGAFGSLVVLMLGLMMLSSLKRGERVENELIDSERRFRSLTDLSSDMYWEQDDQYRFTSSSGSGPEWMVKGLREAAGKRRWDFKYQNMTEKDWAAHIALLDGRKPFRDLEFCRLHESGGKTWMSVSGEPVFDSSGVFKGY